jgi:hypothetical protein
MLSDLQIKALGNGCAACGRPFVLNTRVRTAYHQQDIKSFETQIELGIIGAGVRNIWLHVDCEDTQLLKGWNMAPDIHHCIRCHAKLRKEEIVSPVFSIDDADAVNPADPTDRGLALRERVYFVHADCRNTMLRNNSSNILIKT